MIVQTVLAGVDQKQYDAYGAFAQDRLGPAMAKLGIEAVPSVTFHPAHDVYAPEAVRNTTT